MNLACWLDDQSIHRFMCNLGSNHIVIGVLSFSYNIYLWAYFNTSNNKFIFEYLLFESTNILFSLLFSYLIQYSVNNIIKIK